MTSGRDIKEGDREKYTEIANVRPDQGRGGPPEDELEYTDTRDGLAAVESSVWGRGMREDETCAKEGPAPSAEGSSTTIRGVIAKQDTSNRWTRDVSLKREHQETNEWTLKL